MTLHTLAGTLFRLWRRVDAWLLHWYDRLEPYVLCGLSFPLLYPLCLFLDWRDRRRGTAWPSKRKEQSP
jgi:hypothetical protein